MLFRSIFSFLSEEQLNLVKQSSGKTGERGKEFTKKLREAGIIVEWEKAEAIFQNLTWPKFTRLAEKAFPGLQDLHPDVYGAIVSLVFNRGTSLKGDSRKEMANIKLLIAKKDYKGIAKQLKDMKRLWIGKGLDGLLERRDAEAALVSSAA